MMTFLAGVLAGAGVTIAYRVVRYAQWQRTLIAYGATISRIHARWIITDTLGTFEGHPMEELMAFLNRYNISRTSRTTPWTFAMTSWPRYAGSAATSATRTTRTTPRSTTPDATEER